MSAARRAAALLVATVLVAAQLRAAPASAVSTVSTSSASSASRASSAILAATNPFARAPDQARIELEVASGGGRAPLRLEIWRQGDALTLVRFLDPRERGKFLIRRDDDLYFVSPGARAPVKLAPALAPPGALLFDELARLDLVRDYRVHVRSESDGVVSFDLEALPGTTGPPRLRWVVDARRGLPLRAELLDAGGRATEIVEFREWRNARTLEPSLLIARDLAHGGRPISVRLLSIAPEPVPVELFSLTDGAARRALPPPPPARP